MTRINTVAAPAAIDLSARKARQRNAWRSGDYAVIGTTLQIVGEQLCKALDLRAGQKVLDVAAGNSNLALAAARRFDEVISTDYVPKLLERGRDRANAEGLEFEFREADVENLPFDEASFEVVASTFGVMFTPDQDKAAAELLRVCKPGGKIGLANWTSDGFIGQLFKTLGEHVPPPAGVKSPALWGIEARLVELFGAEGASIDSKPRDFVFRYRSAEHFIDLFRTWYGPPLKAFAALEPAAQAALEADRKALIARLDRSGRGSIVVRNAYLEVVIRSVGKKGHWNRPRHGDEKRFGHEPGTRPPSNKSASEIHRLSRVAARARHVLHARHGEAATAGDREQHWIRQLWRAGRHRDGAATGQSAAAVAIVGAPSTQPRQRCSTVAGTPPALSAIKARALCRIGQSIEVHY